MGEYSLYDAKHLVLMLALLLLLVVVVVVDAQPPHDHHFPFSSDSTDLLFSRSPSWYR